MADSDGQPRSQLLDYAVPKHQRVVCRTSNLILSAILMVIGFPLSLVGFIMFKIADSFGDIGIALCLLPLGALFLWGSWRVQQFKGNPAG